MLNSNLLYGRSNYIKLIYVIAHEISHGKQRDGSIDMLQDNPQDQQNSKNMEYAADQGAYHYFKCPTCLKILSEDQPIQANPLGYFSKLDIECCAYAAKCNGQLCKVHAGIGDPNCLKDYLPQKK